MAGNEVMLVVLFMADICVSICFHFCKMALRDEKALVVDWNPLPGMMRKWEKRGRLK